MQYSQKLKALLEAKLSGNDTEVVSENQHEFADINRLVPEIRQAAEQHAMAGKRLSNPALSFQKKWSELDQAGAEWAADIYQRAHAQAKLDSAGEDHDAWREKTAARRDSRYYHECIQRAEQASNPIIKNHYLAKAAALQESANISEIAYEFQEAMEEILEQVEHAFDMLPSGIIKNRARSYWYGHIKQAAGSDEYPGGSYTMMDTLEELQNGEEEDLQEESANISESRRTNIMGLIGSRGIGSLDQVEKIVDIRSQRDGMSALVRTTDGNAYEVQIRQAAHTQHPELKKFTEDSIDEGKFGKAAGALAVAAALWGGAELTSAKHTPLGKALQQAAQQGDQEAAYHLKKLDLYLDAGDTRTMQDLRARYLDKE